MVLTRSKTAPSRTRRHRGARPGSDAIRPGAGSAPAAAIHSAAARRERAAITSEDRALYTCQCGFVFQALVSTSVDCPHCGGFQAW